ncbi:MAG: hypothetical protein ACLFVJ_19710 [Persicimonas sp.]
MHEEQPPAEEPYFAYISEDADDALEYIFEHPDGISEAELARILGLAKSDFLIDELRLAGIDVRTEVRDGVMMYLAPLRKN